MKSQMLPQIWTEINMLKLSVERTPQRKRSNDTMQLSLPTPPKKIQSIWEPCIFPVSHLTEWDVAPLKQWEPSTKMQMSCVFSFFFPPHHPSVLFLLHYRLPHCRSIGDECEFLLCPVILRYGKYTDAECDWRRAKQITKKKGKWTCYLTVQRTFPVEYSFHVLLSPSTLFFWMYLLSSKIIIL